MSSIFAQLSSLFGSSDTLPWTDPAIINDFEKDVSKEDSGKTQESLMRLAWALVHSKDSADVQRGLAMLETMLGNKDQPSSKREIMYLLAVGNYRIGNYAQSRKLIDETLVMSPDFRQAVVLKETVMKKIQSDGVVGIGLAATAVAAVATGVALLAKKR